MVDNQNACKRVFVLVLVLVLQQKKKMCSVQCLLHRNNKDGAYMSIKFIKHANINHVKGNDRFKVIVRRK